MSHAPVQHSTPAIEMSGVTVGVRNDPQIVVLEDVNWRVASGEYWIIGGMHNTGKSDFLAMIAGLAPPRKGTYRLFGKSMPRDVADQSRLRVGLVFDGGKPLHRLTVAENVLLPLRYHRAQGQSASVDRAREILELTGLLPLAEKMPGDIGRSWEKRLGLARALALQPELLLLDDPLSGLDSRHLIWWMAFLEKLSVGHSFTGDRPVTLVVTGHNLRPWHNRPVSLALVGHRRFVSLGHCKDLSSVNDPLVRELLQAEAVEVS
jgi:ABC-type transporter Mla maintaining outer membrane lipid asymmetry ATPase subunit MlaF